MKSNTSFGQRLPDTTRSPWLMIWHRDARSTSRLSCLRLILPVTAALTCILLYSGIGFASKGGIPGPPPEGEVSNNLSLPAVVTGSLSTVPHLWGPPVVPELGVHYSYGCDLPESDGSFNYPNTSCVNSLTDPNQYYDAAECIADDHPCEGLEVSDVFRIYWQKVDANEWWADDEGALHTTPAYPHRSVAYVDWGDALEAVTPNERSFVRVETQPYTALIPEFDPADPTLSDPYDVNSPPLGSCVGAALAASLDPEIVCKVGLQMWHVSGQGITEHWGVRATDVDPYNSFNYDSPFQIIKTTNARLNVTKMAEGDALCPEPGGNAGDLPPPVGDWNPIASEWGDTCTIYDAPFSVELSVGGKYVYGYNWQLRYVEMSETACPDWLKTGFWRLTFYVPWDEEIVGEEVIYVPKDVIFENADAPNIAPPAIPSEVRLLPRDGNFNTALATVETPLPDAVILRDDVPVLEDEDPDADDRLYKPVIDTDNNLTYIDICVVAKTGGGKK